ncbi:MAG: PKD domain-containing protein, partial [Thermoplasmata archaeon]|nr:PKD domain-containing protein [Thermoplasmata archaeon]
ATNNNDMPVIGIVVIFDSDPLNSDTTNIQGKAYGFDFEFGWHSIDAVNPYQHQGVPTGARAHSWFFSEGFNYDEYFWRADASVEDLNGDEEWNDLNITIYAAVVEETVSTVTTYAYIYYQSNDTLVATNSTTFEVFSNFAEKQNILIFNLPYNETYNATYLLFDSDNNLEDEWYQYNIQVIPITPQINIEYQVNSWENDNIANDINFDAHILDKGIDDVNIKIYNKTNNDLVYNITTANGYVWVDNANNGDYFYIAYDSNNTFIEYGEFYIGTNNEVWEALWDFDRDGYYNDFRYAADQKTMSGRDFTDIDIFVYDLNDKLIHSGDTTTNYVYYIYNLTEGHYKFKAMNNSLRISNGTFYSYGNGFANQPPSPLISSPLNQSEHDPTSSIHFDGTSSTDPDYWDQLTYYWESDLDGNLGETGEFWKQLSEGTHKITLWTDDAHGHNPSTSAAITVQKPIAPNDPPNAILTSPTEAQQFYTTDSISFDGSTSSDPDGDPLTFYWTSNITGAIAGNVSQFSKSLEKGYHNITMFVEDNQSHNVSAMVNISVIEPSVQPNDDPIANISSPVNNSMWNATDLIIFESYGTYDPDDDVNDDGMIDPVNETDNLTYQWTSNITGELSTSPNFNTSELGSPLETGHHLINLTVVDLLGGNATASIEIVIANLPPTASITAPDEGDLYFKSDEIDFLGQSSDPENDVLYYYWEIVDKNSPSNIFKIHNQSLFFRKLPAGEYAVTFYADDHNGVDEFGRDHNISALVNVSVENRAPVAFAGADRKVNTGENVEFNASGSSDPDGAEDEANFTYLWNFGDGSILQDMVVYHAYANSAVYNVSLTVTDTESTTNNTGMDYVKITVNTLP